MIKGGKGCGRGKSKGSGASESSKEELDEKREPKRLAVSKGEMAIESSERKRGGKLELQKKEPWPNRDLGSENPLRPSRRVLLECTFEHQRPYAVRFVMRGGAYKWAKLVGGE